MECVIFFFKFEEPKRAIISHNTKNDILRKNYTENVGLSNMNPTKRGNSCAMEGRVVPDPLVIPVVLLLTATNIN